MADPEPQVPMTSWWKSYGIVILFVIAGTLLVMYGK